MSLTNIGCESTLPSFRKQESIAKTLTDRNTYSKMKEDEAIKQIRGED